MRRRGTECPSPIPSPFSGRRLILMPEVTKMERGTRSLQAAAPFSCHQGPMPFFMKKKAEGPRSDAEGVKGWGGAISSPALSYNRMQRKQTQAPPFRQRFVWTKQVNCLRNSVISR